MSLVLTDADRAAASAWLAERRVTTPFVAVAPGSIWGTKRWPGYAELVGALDKPVVVLGSDADGELAAQVAGAAPGGRIPPPARSRSASRPPSSSAPACW